MVKTAVPFIHSQCTTKGVYRWTLLALAIPTFSLFCLPGADFARFVITVLSSFLAQLWVNYRCNLKLLDNSSIITGILIALMLPVDAPIWAGILASFMAIFGAKTLFGGLGKNWINPACAGIALLLTFPNLLGMPLSQAGGQFLWGYTQGGLAEFSALLVLIGGGILVWKRLANWQIFVPYLAGSFVAGLFLGAMPVAILVWGGTIFGAFFLASDPVTSPVDHRWHSVYGLFGGILSTCFAYFFPAMGGVSLGLICTNLLGRLADFLSAET